MTKRIHSRNFFSKSSYEILANKGVNESTSWQASSTIARARKILADGGCHGRYWNRVKQIDKHFVSGHSKSLS
jgi:hypothetical protein